jgi:hypothetical protein
MILHFLLVIRGRRYAVSKSTEMFSIFLKMHMPKRNKRARLCVGSSQKSARERDLGCTKIDNSNTVVIAAQSEATRGIPESSGTGGLSRPVVFEVTKLPGRTWVLHSRSRWYTYLTMCRASDSSESRWALAFGQARHTDHRGHELDGQDNRTAHSCSGCTQPSVAGVFLHLGQYRSLAGALAHSLEMGWVGRVRLI